MKCKKLFALLLSLCMIASSFVAVSVVAETVSVIDIDLPLDDASELTWVQSGVTVSNADGIGGRDNVVKAEGLSNSNNNTAGIKFPDGFAFEEGDVLTYSVDVYSETVINPDMWLRNHNGNILNPFETFYSQPMATNQWVTITQTLTYTQLNEGIPSNSSGSFGDIGNYALYLRPRQNATVYLDNFKVTVTGTPREVAGGEEDTTDGFTVTPTVNYAKKENGAYKFTTADVAANDASGAWASLVRLRVIPDEAISKDEDVQITFDFDSVGILNSVGQPYAEMDVNVRFYDSVDGANQAATIGYVLKKVASNTGSPVTVTYKLSDMVKNGGTSTKTEIKSIGIQVNMDGACKQYQKEANDSYFTISNIQVGEVTEDPTPTPTPTPDAPTPTPDAPTGEVIHEITAGDATGLTMVGANVTLTDNQSIGGKDGVVKAEGVSKDNGGQVGIKLPDGFSFKEGDTLTYSVDVYAESAIKPDIYVRNHDGWNPMAVFYSDAIAANTWTTVTKTVTFAELEAQIGPSNSSGTFADAGNYAVYLRPRDASVMYLDNFKVTVNGTPRGEEEEKAPSTNLEVKGFLEQAATTTNAGKLNYTFEDGTFKVDVKELAKYSNTQNLTGNSFVRVIPETPIDVESNFILTYDVETSGIKDVTKLKTAIRFFEDKTSSDTTKTIGWLRSEVKTNSTETVTITKIGSIPGETGQSESTKIGSMGIILDVQSIADAEDVPEDAYIKISNVKIEYILDYLSHEAPVVTSDSATVKVTFENIVVESSIKNGCSVKGKENNNFVVDVVKDENDSKTAIITISGLVPSTEYELVLEDYITPETTIAFKTLDEATVDADYASDKLTYTITNNNAEATTIYAVLLRCKGNVVTERKVVTYSNCASGADVSGEITPEKPLEEGEYFKFFAWTVDNGYVNSLAPCQMFE